MQAQLVEFFLDTPIKYDSRTGFGLLQRPRWFFNLWQELLVTIIDIHIADYYIEIPASGIRPDSLDFFIFSQNLPDRGREVELHPDFPGELHQAFCNCVHATD